MKVFPKVILIVVAFLILVCLLYLGFNKPARKPMSKYENLINDLELVEREFDKWVSKFYYMFTDEDLEGEWERQNRAIDLVKDRYWSELKSVMESLENYVEHIGWVAYKLPREGLFDRYTYAESTYIVSYTYTTVELLRKEMVRGWRWEVVFGDNTVRLIDEKQYMKEKALADSIKAHRRSTSERQFRKEKEIKRDSSR